MNIYLDSFLTFTKIGAFTLGGGYAMVPLIEKEVVDKKKWIDKKEFLDMLSIAHSSPGILAVNISIFVGYKLKGIPGSLVTTLGSILPSFVIILLIAMFFEGVQDSPIVESIFKGVRPAVVALIVVPVINLSRTINLNKYTIMIPIATVLLVWWWNVSPVYVILVGGIGGLLYQFVFLKKIKKH